MSGIAVNRLGYTRPDLAPTEQATVRDIIWAAGVYEGEGSPSLTGRSPYLSEHVTVSQKDPWLVNQLCSLFGGSIYDVKNRDLWAWDIYGARARGFLQSVYGLLSPRRQEQARRVLKVGEFA